MRILVVLAMSAALAANANVTVDEIHVSASAIQWTASGQYNRLVLTVSGPQEVVPTLVEK